MLKAKRSDWYKTAWTLDIKNQSWTEHTENQVDFIIKALGLVGNERILDLACGFGRHALSFVQKGYSVVGVDITKDYIDDARSSDQAEKPACSEGNSSRLYSKAELRAILGQRHMKIVNTFSNYHGKADSCQELQLLVYSQKE